MRQLPLLLAMFVASPWSLAATHGDSIVAHGSGDPQNGAVPQGSNTDLEKAKRALRQPGPEGREARERAVDEMLAMADREAHVALCEAINWGGKDADRLNELILDSLRRKWRTQGDAVFGQAAGGRAALHRLYATTLVTVFEGEPAVAESGRRAELQRLVWRCFRGLTPLDRRRVFDSFVTAPDAQQFRLSMWTMAGCRDLGLAQLLGEALDHEDAATGEVARSALALLTFARPFVTRAEFDAWIAKNRDRDYSDIVEQAARGRNFATQQRLSALEADLIEALALNETVDWKKIHDTLRSAVTIEPYLERLREVLIRKTSLGGASDDRLALVAKLQADLETGLGPVEFGLRLQVMARLVDAAEAKSAGVLERLVAAVKHSDAGVRESALRGLAAHFSADTRRVVVGSGVAAMQARENGVLAGVLDCLAVWPAPSRDTNADVVAWLGLLDSVLAANELPDKLKEQAIQSLIQPTAEKARLAQSFEALRRVAHAGRGLPVPVRKQALGRLRLFTGDAERAEQWVKFVSELLSDADPLLREAAARTLRQEPLHDSRRQQEEWTRRIVTAVGERLLVETEEAPLRAAFDCLMQRELGSGPEEDSSHVIGKFTNAVDVFMKADPAGQQPFRRDILVSGLKQLGGVKNRPLAQWQRAAEGLAALEDRQALRFVLERHAVPSLAGQNGEAVVNVWKVVVRGALLKPADEPWSRHAAEALEVCVAFNELDRAKAAPDDPEHRVLRVLTLVAANRHDEAIRRGVAALGERARPLEARDRVEVALAVATAQTARSALGEARELLATLDAADPRVVAAHVELAQAHIGQSQYEPADELMAGALAATPESDPSFAERFLVAQIARYRRAPKANAAAVAAALRERDTLYREGQVGAALRPRFDELMAEIERGQG